jgi:hypothetical protein
MGTKHGVRGGNGDEFLSSCSSLIKRRFRLQSIAYGTSVFHQLRISQGCLATLTVSPKIAGPLRDLMTYMEAQSIASTTFLINSRSVFQRPSRTTNDCEGWPTKQNQNVYAAGVKLYLLINQTAHFDMVTTISAECGNNHILLNRYNKTIW